MVEKALNAALLCLSFLMDLTDSDSGNDLSQPVFRDIILESMRRMASIS